MSDALVEGPDGRLRCFWAGSAPEYIAYHDEEWGRPVTTDQGLYERMTLEAFQSGLAWITILRKRESFRAAFAGFEIERVAAFGEEDFARLMADAGIVRNRAEDRGRDRQRARRAGRAAGGADLVVRARRRGRRARARAPRARRPRRSPRRSSKALKKAGFRFVGPTTAYALMQACGLVDDHFEGCHVPAA